MKRELCYIAADYIIRGRKPEVTEFQWITSMKITERNAEKMAGIVFGKTALRMVFPEEKWHKKGDKKCVSSSVSLL